MNEKGVMKMKCQENEGKKGEKEVLLGIQGKGKKKI